MILWVIFTFAVVISIVASLVGGFEVLYILLLGLLPSRFGGNSGNEKNTQSEKYAAQDDLLYNVGLNNNERARSLANVKILVTGANKGLGKAIAIDLCSRGADLLLACRSDVDTIVNTVKLAAAVAGGNALNLNAKCEAFHLDLSDLSSVQGLIDHVKKENWIFDVVILNAGKVSASRQLTCDGFESTFQVNFLANGFLVHSLLGEKLLANSSDKEPPHVIFVVSEAHRDCKRLDTYGEIGNPGPEFNVLQGMERYAHSKACSISFASELARRRNDIKISCICPGPVNSDIGREAPSFVKPLVSVLMNSLFPTPKEAAKPVVQLALRSHSPAVHSSLADVSGEFVDNFEYYWKWRQVDPSLLVYASREKIWTAFHRLINQYRKNHQSSSS